MFPALLGAIAPAVIGGIFSSHANKKQNKSNQKQAVHQREVELQDDATRFTRLRDAAVAGGFNPLTALQFGGTTTGFGSGRVANQVFDWGPTASAAMSAAIPEISGQAGVARQREILEQDLLKVQTDALRVQSAVTQAANAAQAFAPIGSNLGSFGASGGSRPASVAAGGLAPGRPVERKPVENIPGVMQIDNAITGNEPAWVWGSDGDPWDIWQHAAVWGQVAPQIVKDVPLLAPSFGEMFTIEENSPVGRLRESIRNWAGSGPVTVTQPNHSSGRPSSPRSPFRLQ